MNAKTTIANIELVKQVNSAVVYRLIDRQGPISRVRIAELSGLAPASVTKITRQLLAFGLIREEAQQASTGGRRAISLVAEHQPFQIVAARLGRGELDICLYDLAGQQLAGKQVPLTEVTQEEVSERLLAELERFIGNQQQRIRQLIAVGLTLPGLVDPFTGEVIYTPHYPLRYLPLAQILRERLHCPAYIGNDTRALALAEHYFGASRDCLDSILISVHGGTGAGIITNGEVFLGQNRNVGEIGHIQVDPLGKPCHCGNFGCLETIASNSAIVARFRELAAAGHPTRLTLENLTIDEICRAANDGDRLATQVIEEVGTYLGRAIAITINLLNPQKVLIAGEIVAAADILFAAIRRCVVRQSLPSFHESLPIEPAAFQQQPTMGAFALIKRALLDGSLLQYLLGNGADGHADDREINTG